MPKEWFSHDYGTRNKKRLGALIEGEGTRGYGLFWIIVEMLYEDSNKYLELDDVTILSIKKEAKEDPDYVREFIRKCLEVYKVFRVVKKKYFSTERVIENTKLRKELSAKKSYAGIKSAESRKKKSTHVQHMLAAVPPVLTQVNKGEESKVKESKEDEREKGESTSDIQYSIERCLEIAMADPRWVKASGATKESLEEFNQYLESMSMYEKNPQDYKQHFVHRKRKRDTGEDSSENRQMVM